MKVGIISDSHDHLTNLARVIKLFRKEDISFLLHAGDFIAPFAIGQFKDLNCNWLGVFGNNDGERKGLAKASGGRIQEGPLGITLSGVKIVLVHDINQINPSREDARLIVSGHTHKLKIQKESGRLLLNPGECCGWLTGRATAMTVDLEKLTSKVFQL